MKSSSLYGAVALIVVSTSAADAACNSICQGKCRQAAAGGNTTYEACYAKWSKINAELKGNRAALDRAEDKYRGQIKYRGN